MVNMTRYRRAIEQLYTGRMTVMERCGIKDDTTKRTGFKDVVVYADIPCRLSYSGTPVNTAENGAYRMEQEIKLFCAPELDIKPGSKITVTQNGVTRAYIHGGKSAVYSAHMEISLELEGEYA